jgi:gliding motility-associated-like protein
MLIATGPGGCADTVLLNNAVTVYPKPHAEFNVTPGFNQFVSIDDATFSFINLSQGATSYLWNFGDNSTSTAVNPIHKYEDVGSFSVMLIATSYYGCMDTAMRNYIHIVEKGDVYIPNSFTPNGDGINDFFKIYGKGITKVYFVIYDRWGEKVYDTDNNTPWDGNFKGKPMNTAVFVYWATVEFETGKKGFFKGDITLLR